VDDVFGFPWILLWLVALVGILVGISGAAAPGVSVSGGGGGGVATQAVRVAVAAPALILVGVLALRAAVIFSVQ
jgi:hypothetical protein